MKSNINQKHKDYWRMRFEQLEESLSNKSDAYYNELIKQYDIALSKIEKDISYWYMRFVANNNVSFIEANRLLTTKELKELKWTVQEYIEFGKENAINQMWMNELENASARAHMSRLESLKLQIQNQIEVLYSKQSVDIDNLIKNIYTEGYYHTAYEIAKGIQVATNLAKLDNNRINKVISKPWTVDGINFSERIWGKHRAELIEELHTQLTQSIIRGEDPQKVIDIIAKKFDVSKNQAGNLVMTESAFFASQSQKDCYEDLDIEKYEVVATLDTKTSRTCQDLDGKVFEMKYYEVGVTAPPFHNYCRTTTSPYFEDDLDSMRAARSEDGKIYYIPANIKYHEWMRKYVK